MKKIEKIIMNSLVYKVHMELSENQKLVGLVVIILGGLAGIEIFNNNMGFTL